MFRYVILLSLAVLMLTCKRQELNYELLHAPFLQLATAEADSLLLTMSTDEKIGQLLIFQPKLQDSLDRAHLLTLTTESKLGGVILEDLKFLEYTFLIDSLQKVSKTPLFNGSRNLISLHNQFSDITNLPSPATISAIEDDSLKTRIATYFIDQLVNLGFNISFAPSLNINTLDKDFEVSASNINSTQLLEYSVSMMEKIQQHNILSVAGDFDELHYLQNDTIGTLDSILHRYNNLVHNGVSGIHIDSSIFQIDTLNILPPHFLKRFLNQHIEFNGLMIADWETQSFQKLAYTGVDVFIVKDSFERRFNAIRTLVDQGLFTETDLNQKVSKILLAKSWMGLDTSRTVIDRSIAQSILEAGFDDFEIRKMYENSLTLLQNPKHLLPYKNTYKKPFRLIQIGEEELWDFQNYFSKFAAFSSMKILPDSNGMLRALTSKDIKRSKVIISLDNVHITKEQDSAFIASVNTLGQSNEIVLINFGSPLNLIHFDSTVALIQNYERNPIMESLSAQLLFGALQAKGKLPIALNDRLSIQHGIDDTPITRLKYTVPEEVGIAAFQLVGIDAMARNAIDDKATPGCQVLVAKDGKIIYSKSFGKHEFKGKRLVQHSDLYDLASITKVAATTMGMMKLYDEKKIKLSHSLKQHIDLGTDSKLKNITLQDLMTHRSGLQSNMPIAPYIMYEDTTGTGCNGFFCNEKVLSYVTPIADSLYMDFKWQDSIWQEVYKLVPRKRKRYLYSDVNFNLLMKVIESKEETPLNDYLNRIIYEPMNLQRLTYKPLERFKKREIVPTTDEEKFRKQLIHGYVHDESAALLGGVGGNAGLFGNAESLAPLFQMLLNKGTYGGKQFFKDETVSLFTKKQRSSNRGLGFDVKTKSETWSCSPKASAKTYGHTGFTGTCVWVDPESELIFIFLSNRIHPSIKNRKLFRNKIRTRIQSLVYDALNTYPETISNNKGTEKILEAHVASGE